LAIALGRNLGLILATAVVATLAGIGYGLQKDAVYGATTLLFLPQSSNEGRLAALTGAGGGGTNSKLVSTILGSRSLAEEVRRRAGQPQGMQVQQNTDGSIRITAMHSDPNVAAAIANAYPVALNSIVTQTGVQTGRQKESLLERQIADVRTQLERSEEDLVRYQTGRNAGNVEGQAAATLSAAVQLQQRIADKEVAIATLRRTSTPDNPQLRSANAELAMLRQQLDRLASGGGAGRVLVPLQAGPALRVGAARVQREYARNEQLYVALSTTLAQARIETNGALPVVTVIDPATVPGAPQGPGLPTYAVVAGVLGLVAGACLAIALELVRYARRDPERDPFLAVRDGVRGRSAAPLPARR
jgi:uncharacterized protein involved in exopolysaccharide biosynthesis